MSAAIRLRHITQINPATPEFDKLPADAEVTFLPLEAVWAGSQLDITRLCRKSEVTTGYTRFREGDILIPKITPTFEADRSTIAVGLKGDVGAGTTELHVIRPNPETDCRYVKYLVSSRSFLLGGEAGMTGVAGQKRVPDSWLRNFPVHVTTKSRQAAIADFLDAETARIDALIAKKTRLGVAITARVLTSIESAIWAPKYKHISLRRVCSFIDYRGATPSKSNSGVPLITASHIRDGWLDMKNDPQWVDESTYHEWMRRGLPAVGDVLLTTEAPLGNVAQITDSQVALAQRVILLKPNKSAILADFLALALRSPLFKNTLLAHATGSTALGIKADRLKGLSVPVPSLNLQLASVREMMRQEATADRVRRALNAQIALLRQRKQALITAAVTGEMDVPGAPV